MTTIERQVLADQGTGVENEIYTRRFSAAEEQTRQIVWRVLCQEFFQPMIGKDDVVIDIGAGDGLFTKNISARRRIAVDLSPHVNELSKHGIEVFQVPADRFNDQLSEKADFIFMSNFLEHLPDKRTLLRVFEECHRALKTSATIVILQPNIRLVGPRYWDYIDHHIALTESSLVEALEVSNFNVVKVIARFLPYTAKSRLGQVVSGERTEAFTRFYLNNPVLWQFFGKQSLVVATPRDIA